MSDYPYSRPWLVEQHIQIPELAGQWLIANRCYTEAEASTRTAGWRATAHRLETFRVRDARVPQGAQMSLLGGAS